MKDTNINNWNTNNKKKAIKSFLIIFGITVFTFSLINLFNQNNIIGILELLLSFYTIFLYRSITTVELIKLEAQSVLMITLLSFAFIFFNAVGDCGYIWAVTSPFFISYLTSLKKFLKWILFFTTIIVIFSLIIWLQNIQLYWSWALGPYLLFAFIIVSLLSYFFSKQNEVYIKMLVDAMIQAKKDAQIISKSEAKTKILSLAIEQAGEAVIITDKQGNIEYINPAFTRITGFNKEESIGQTLRLLKSGIQETKFYQEMWETINSGKLWKGKLIDKKKDQSLFPVMLTISPIINDISEVIQFVAVQSDLSKIDQLENQIRQSQKMEAIGTMVGGIAHNFNNMLAGINGNLYLAKQRSIENEYVLNKIKSVENISLHAAEMIQHLLAFARKGIISMENILLTDYINDTLKLLEVLIPENVSIKLKITEDKLVICGDKSLLHQVLLNLYSNARDALLNTNDPEINISLKSFNPDTSFLINNPNFKKISYAQFSISDNGIGIAKEKLEYLFEPFFTTKDQGQGTGLGLSMAYGAIKSHNGFIEVESKINKGSTFHIYIPLVENENAFSTIKERELLARGNNEVILLADDDQIILDILSEILLSIGYQVLKAKDGQIALELFKSHQDEIKIAILDVIMPNLGGLDLSKIIRKSKKDLPIIFLTGYDQNQVFKSDQHLSNSTLITKPVEFDDLSHVIKKYLSEKKL